MASARLSILASGQAAKAGWPSRQTIYRKVRSGELSAEPDANGTAVIDTSELIRVFGEPASRDTAPETPQSDSGLQAQVSLLQLELTRAREDLAGERAHRDRLLGLLETAQRQLFLPPWRAWRTRQPREPERGVAVAASMLGYDMIRSARPGRAGRFRHAIAG